MVTLRNPNATPLLSPGTSPALALVNATYSFLSPGVVSLSISGVVRGIISVIAAASVSTSAPVLASAVPDPGSGFFTITFVGLPALPGDVLSLAASTPGGGPTDHASWRLDRQGPALTSGHLAGVPAQRQDFVAGVPDRLLRTRFFAPLLAGHRVFGAYSSVGVVSADGGLELVDVGRVELNTAPDVRKLLAKGRKGKLSVNAFQDARKILLASALETAAVTERADHADLLKGFSTSFAALGSASPRHLVLNGKSAHATLLYGPVATSAWTNRWNDFLSDFLDKQVQELPFGIVFTDRLRFQPAGLVVGERVYALSLGAGEEVQLRQVVETRRQTIAEDVKDRENENELTLSSTWSTEITDTLKENQSHQNSNTEGLSANADLKDLTAALTGVPIPIQLGASASFSASGANDTSTEHSQKQNQEATVTATARMRAQHRVRFEVTNEQSSSLTTTRTLKNSNRQRALTYIFHKLYRKERVTLERVDARLCLRLPVRNPAALTRAAFVSGIDKLDPNDARNYHLDVPAAVDSSWRVQLDGPDSIPSGTVSDDEVASGIDTATLPSFKLKTKFGIARAGDVPAGYLLADLPTMTLDQFSWGRETHYGSAEFEQMGGKVKWITVPAVASPDPAGVIKTSLPWVTGETSSAAMHDVWATFRASWVPSAADLTAYNAARARERARLEDELKDNRALIYSLRDIAVREFPGVVLGAVADQYFADRAVLQNLASIFDLGALHLDMLPHWATREGRQVYSRLHNRLNLLPLTLTPSEILVPELTAPLARVFLPIREGMEKAAAGLMKSWPIDTYRAAAAEVETIRARDYAPVPRTFDAPDVVCGPQPPKGTSIGAVTWQTEWEKPLRSFKVLGQWQELIPTDGVHLEMKLSDSVATDEALTDAIGRDAQ